MAGGTVATSALQSPGRTAPWREPRGPAERRLRDSETRTRDTNLPGHRVTNQKPIGNQTENDALTCPKVKTNEKARIWSVRIDCQAERMRRKGELITTSTSCRMGPNL